MPRDLPADNRAAPRRGPIRAPPRAVVIACDVPCRERPRVKARSVSAPTTPPASTLEAVSGERQRGSPEVDVSGTDRDLCRLTADGGRLPRRNTGTDATYSDGSRLRRPWPRQPARPSSEGSRVLARHATKPIQTGLLVRRGPRLRMERQQAGVRPTYAAEPTGSDQNHAPAGRDQED